MRDGLAPVLQLYRNLEKTAQQDDPKYSKARFRPKCRRRNELAGTYNGCRKNQSGAEVFERGEETAWRIEKRRRTIGFHLRPAFLA